MQARWLRVPSWRFPRLLLNGRGRLALAADINLILDRFQLRLDLLLEIAVGGRGVRQVAVRDTEEDERRRLATLQRERRLLAEQLHERVTRLKAFVLGRAVLRIDALQTQQHRDGKAAECDDCLEEAVHGVVPMLGGVVTSCARMTVRKNLAMSPSASISSRVAAAGA